MGTLALNMAPYEEVEVPERVFKVCVSQTLSRNTEVSTQDYSFDADDYPDTSETDWKAAYKVQHFSPIGIIRAAQEISQALLSTGQKKVAGIYLESLANDCKNWICDDFEVIEE